MGSLGEVLEGSLISGPPACVPLFVFELAVFIFGSFVSSCAIEFMVFLASTG